jgi:hypothetical protein
MLDIPFFDFFRNDIRNGFYQYFQALAIPSEDYMFDANYKQLVDLDFLLIEQITDQSSNSTITISLEDITSAIKEMNRGKASDILGIWSGIDIVIPSYFGYCGCSGRSLLLNEFMEGFRIVLRSRHDIRV